jgi:hypothetical protein
MRTILLLEIRHQIPRERNDPAATQTTILMVITEGDLNKAGVYLNLQT